MLNHRIALRVPSLKRDGTEILPLKRNAKITQLLRQFAEAFGGAELTSARGVYILADGRLMSEAVDVIASFADVATIAALANVFRSRAVQLCVEFDQETVALEIDGTLEIISAD